MSFAEINNKGTVYPVRIIQQLSSQVYNIQIGNDYYNVFKHDLNICSQSKYQYFTINFHTENGFEKDPKTYPSDYVPRKQRFRKKKN